MFLGLPAVWILAVLPRLDFFLPEILQDYS